MSQSLGATTKSDVFVPLKLDERSLGVKVAAVLLGTLFLAISSWTEVPMWPVPLTMQTFAVPLIAALMGWRLAGVTVLAWFAQAAVGLPVFASGGGLAYFAGPTGGYLVGFLVTAIAVGWCAERGWTRTNVFSSFAVMLAANIIILALGALWLAQLIGTEAAIASGVTPFIVGAFIKSALVVATIEAAFKLKTRRS